MTRIVLSFLTLFVGISSLLSAQIYPYRTDAEKIGLKGKVKTTSTVVLPYSPAAERWEPLRIKIIEFYNPSGNLLRKKTFIQHVTSTTPLFTYDKKSDSLRPILESTAAQTGSAADSGRLIMDQVFTYMTDGRIETEIERDYQMGKTLRRLYVYAGSRLKYRVEQDSALDAIISLEEFSYMAGSKPQGSIIRHYNPATDLLRSLKDTADVPEKRITYDYTSYIYGDTLTPTIFWRWYFGGDTIVDRQEIHRFLEGGELAATIDERFQEGKLSQSSSKLFNLYGDPLSTADSFGNDTTYQRAFDYIYDELDQEGNWRVKREYVAADPGNPDSGERLLLKRIERVITYYEE